MQRYLGPIFLLTALFCLGASDQMESFELADCERLVRAKTVAADVRMLRKKLDESQENTSAYIFNYRELLSVIQTNPSELSEIDRAEISRAIVDVVLTQKWEVFGRLRGTISFADLNNFTSRPEERERQIIITQLLSDPLSFYRLLRRKQEAYMIDRFGRRRTPVNYVVSSGLEDEVQHSPAWRAIYILLAPVTEPSHAARTGGFKNVDRMMDNFSFSGQRPEHSEWMIQALQLLLAQESADSPNPFVHDLIGLHFFQCYDVWAMSREGVVYNRRYFEYLENTRIELGINADPVRPRIIRYATRTERRQRVEGRRWSLMMRLWFPGQPQPR